MKPPTVLGYFELLLTNREKRHKEVRHGPKERR